MSTVGGMQLVREELELLEQLCSTRLLRILEAERERDMYMEGERRVERLNEEIHAQVEAACCALALGKDGSTPDLIGKLINCARKKDALVDQLEPVCNRLAAVVEREFGRTPESFDDALTMLVAEVYRLRAPNQAKAASEEDPSANPRHPECEP